MGSATWAEPMKRSQYWPIPTSLSADVVAPKTSSVMATPESSSSARAYSRKASTASLRRRPSAPG